MCFESCAVQPVHKRVTGFGAHEIEKPHTCWYFARMAYKITAQFRLQKHYAMWKICCNPQPQRGLFGTHTGSAASRKLTF